MAKKLNWEDANFWEMKFMYYRDFLPRTQDGRIKIQEPLAIACLCPKVPRAQVQDPKEPLEISVKRSQGKDILAVFHIFGGGS